MSLLRDDINNRTIEKTELTRKLTIDGVTKIYPVYKIKLDALYYNDKNDRIATWISKHKSEHNNIELNHSDRESYNSTIQEFIIESNKASIEKTKNNIKTIGQQIAGVVLDDGRIVDGNRRFTCLRLLHGENIHQSNFFEAVILDYDYVNNAKEIKKLELSTQHGEDQKIDYNPIDRLVGLYNDVVENKLLTVSEYAQLTNKSENEIKRELERAELMIEYLDWIGAPKQFYVARENDIDDSLREINAILKKCRNEEQKDSYKQTLFHALLVKPDSDISNYIGKIKHVVNSPHETVFLEEQVDYIQETLEVLYSEDIENTDAASKISNVRKNENLTGEVDRSIKKAIEKARREQDRNAPLDFILKSINSLDMIDLKIINKLSDAQKDDILQQLSILDDKVADIRENIGE